MVRVSQFVGMASLIVIQAIVSADAQGFPPAAVIVSEVQEGQIAQDVSFMGSVQPRHSSLVAAETAGMVVRRFKEGGQAVRVGEVLFRLGNDQLVAALVEALADVKYRKSEFQQHEQLLRQEAVAENAVREAEYELDRARAKLQDLQHRLENLSVRSPFDGHIIQTLREVGEWVDQGDGLARIIAIDTVRVFVNVPERFVDRMRLGEETSVSIQALGTDPYPARIVAILAEGFAESRTFPVVVEMLNPHGRMRSNMAARVTFSVRQTEPSLLVHKDAIVNGAQGTVVFVADGEVAAMRLVTTGNAHRGFVEVDGDLQPGDLAIVRGNERLRDGQAVRVIRKQQ